MNINSNKSKSSYDPTVDEYYPYDRFGYYIEDYNGRKSDNQDGQWEKVDQIPNNSDKVTEVKNLFSNIPANDGEYGGGGRVGIINPTKLISLQNEKFIKLRRISKEFSKQIHRYFNRDNVNHTAALKKYLTVFRYNQESQYPNRKGVHYREGVHYSKYEWKEAAVHLLPLEIIDSMDKLVHFEEVFKGSIEYCPKFNIPCFVKSNQDFKGIGAMIEFTKATIEFTITPEGKPIHLFLRVLQNKNDKYLKKNLGSKKDVLKALNNAEFPTLNDASRYNAKPHFSSTQKVVDDNLFMTFFSKFGLDIRIKKNNNISSS